MPLTRSLAALLAALTLLPQFASAADAIAVTTPLAHPVKLPAKALQTVTDDIGSRYARYRCTGPVEANIEAGSIDLGPQLRQAMVVKPSQNCLCGASGCRYWLFSGTGADAAYLGRVNAGSFRIASQTTKGAYDLIAVAPAGTESRLRFNGNVYLEQDDRSGVIPQN